MLLKSYPTIITHNVSAGALLCDATTANAFIAPTGIDFTPYRGKQIEIWSGSTLWARAWVSGAAPTALEEATDVLAGWDFTSGWATSNATVNNATQFTATANNGTVRKAYATIGSLYKYVVDGGVSAGTVQYAFRNTSGDLYEIGVADGTYYATARGTELLVKATNVGAQFTMVSQNLYAVTSPAPTGALLLSSNGGSRGYAYKHASFNPNAAVTLRVLATRVFSGNGSYIR